MKGKPSHCHFTVQTNLGLSHDCSQTLFIYNLLCFFDIKSQSHVITVLGQLETLIFYSYGLSLHVSFFNSMFVKLDFVAKKYNIKHSDWGALDELENSIEKLFKTRSDNAKYLCYRYACTNDPMFENKRVEIMGDNYIDLWIAADFLIKKSGDRDHTGCFFSIDKLFFLIKNVYQVISR
jgi:hypothetical protein